MCLMVKYIGFLKYLDDLLFMINCAIFDKVDYRTIGLFIGVVAWLSRRPFRKF